MPKGKNTLKHDHLYTALAHALTWFDNGVDQTATKVKDTVHAIVNAVADCAVQVEEFDKTLQSKPLIERIETQHKSSEFLESMDSHANALRALSAAVASKIKGVDDTQFKAMVKQAFDARNDSDFVQGIVRDALKQFALDAEETPPPEYSDLV